MMELRARDEHRFETSGAVGGQNISVSRVYFGVPVPHPKKEGDRWPVED